MNHLITDTQCMLLFLSFSSYKKKKHTLIPKTYVYVFKLEKKLLSFMHCATITRVHYVQVYSFHTIQVSLCHPFLNTQVHFHVPGLIHDLKQRLGWTHPFTVQNTKVIAKLHSNFTDKRPALNKNLFSNNEIVF